MKKFKKLPLFLAVGLVSSLLVGCNVKSNKPKPTTSTDPVMTSTPTQTGVTTPTTTTGVTIPTTVAQEEVTIKFLDYNDEVISTKNYKIGDTIILPADPVRPDDDNYHYTFIGWGEEIGLASVDKTYKANYSKKAFAKIKNVSDISKTYDGNAVTAPTYECDSNGEVIIEYKEKEASDTEYKTEAPKITGRYQVRITLKETDDYTSDVYVKDFYIKSETDQLLVIQALPEIELILDEYGYVKYQTALNEYAMPMLKNKNYVNLSKHEAITNIFTDLKEYGYIDDYYYRTTYIKGSESNELSVLQTYAYDTISDLNLNTGSSKNLYVYSNSYSNYDISNLVLNNVFYYTSSEVNNMSKAKQLEELCKVRELTKNVNDINCKRMYALYYAIKLLKLRAETGYQSMTTAQASTYSGISSLYNSVNSLNASFPNNALNYYNSYLSISSSYGIARNDFESVFPEYYEAVNNNLLSKDIYAFILFTVTGGSLTGNASGASSYFGGSLTSQYNSVINEYYNRKSSLEQLYQENNIDIDSVIAEANDDIIAAVDTFIQKYDIDFTNLTNINVTGDFKYYFVNGLTNETYYLTDVPTNGGYYYNHICYIYDGKIAQEDLANYTPTRYCTYSVYDDYIAINDYKTQEVTRLTINGDSSLSINNIPDGELKYIINSNSYGSGTYAFYENEGVKTAYCYTGVHLKDELENHLVGYYEKYSWDEKYGHVYLYFNDNYSNYVIDHDIYLKQYNIEFDLVEVNYTKCVNLNGTNHNLVFFTIDGFHYVMSYVKYSEGETIELTREEIEELIFNHETPSFGIKGDYEWKYLDSDHIYTDLGSHGDEFVYFISDTLIDVTNEPRSIQILYTKKISDDQFYTLILYTNHFGLNRYEVRFYDNEVTNDQILDDYRANGFIQNNYSWYETDDLVYVYEISHVLSEYNNEPLGKILYIYSKSNDTLVEFDDTAKEFEYYYFDEDTNYTYALYTINGANIAYKYNGSIAYEDILTTNASILEMVTWTTKLEGTNDWFYLYNVIEDNKTAKLYISEGKILNKMKVYNS